MCRKLTLKRNLEKIGRSDEWTCSSEGLRDGIGKSRVEAKGSFLGANLDAFGVTEHEDIDPASVNETVIWKKEN